MNAAGGMMHHLNIRPADVCHGRLMESFIYVSLQKKQTFTFTKTSCSSP